jgi:hypothetical protein
LVRDDPENPAPTKATIRGEYLEAIREVKDENPGASEKTINELARMTIDEDRSLFLRKRKSVVEPHMYELVYGAFDNKRSGRTTTPGTSSDKLVSLSSCGSGW